VVGSQTANLTPGPFFDHNLCCRCPNGSCKAILDIYTSRPFQWYKEHFNASCFDLCNCVLSFWESRRTPKSHFWECEWRLTLPSKWGCDTLAISGLPLGSPGTKSHLDVGFVERHRVYTITTGGYFAIHISSQTTKKEVSESPPLRTRTLRKLLSLCDTKTFAPVQS